MMLKKELKIVDENSDAIEAALKVVNGRASRHAVTSMGKVREIAEMATKALDRRDVRIADRKGAVVSYVPAGPSAKAYRFDVATTLVTLRMASDGRTWRLAGASPAQVTPKKQADLDISLTRAGHAGYLEARRADFGCYKTPEEMEADRQARLLADTEQRLRRQAANAERQEQEAMDDLAQFVV